MELIWRFWWVIAGAALLTGGIIYAGSNLHGVPDLVRVVGSIAWLAGAAFDSGAGAVLGQGLSHAEGWLWQTELDGSVALAAHPPATGRQEVAGRRFLGGTALSPPEPGCAAAPRSAPPRGGRGHPRRDRLRATGFVTGRPRARGGTRRFRRWKRGCLRAGECADTPHGGGARDAGEVVQVAGGAARPCISSALTLTSLAVHRAQSPIQTPPRPSVTSGVSVTTSRGALIRCQVRPVQCSRRPGCRGAGGGPRARPDVAGPARRQAGAGDQLCVRGRLPPRGATGRRSSDTHRPGRRTAPRCTARPARGPARRCPAPTLTMPAPDSWSARMGRVNGELPRGAVPVIRRRRAGRAGCRAGAPLAGPRIQASDGPSTAASCGEGRPQRAGRPRQSSDCRSSARPSGCRPGWKPRRSTRRAPSVPPPREACDRQGPGRSPVAPAGAVPPKDQRLIVQGAAGRGARADCPGLAGA